MKLRNKNQQRSVNVKLVIKFETCLFPLDFVDKFGARSVAVGDWWSQQRCILQED